MAEPPDSYRFVWTLPKMAPPPWPVRPLPTSIALAEWLGLGARELDWFAACWDQRTWTSVQALQHYSYRWMRLKHGKARLLEVPKSRLKRLQRRVLHEILDYIPPHEAAHGFRRGRSTRSYAEPHVGQAMVLRFDLRDFFPSIHAGRVHALFRRLGYPLPVARLLTGLCTHIVPEAALRAGPAGIDPWVYRTRHLPQGAPTSPALANLCTYHLDCRLARLAASIGARYTRYADDLAFSGGPSMARCARRLQVRVGLIALEEGFALNMRKSRFMRRGVRQQLAGIVINDHRSIGRDEFDRLKAILHNCVRHGPASQNRNGYDDFRAHLRGRIEYVRQLHPGRGRKLLNVYQQICWDDVVS